VEAFWAHCSVEVLVHGNATADDALALLDLVTPVAAVPPASVGTRSADLCIGHETTDALAGTKRGVVDIGGGTVPAVSPYVPSSPHAKIPCGRWISGVPTPTFEVTGDYPTESGCAVQAVLVVGIPGAGVAYASRRLCHPKRMLSSLSWGLVHATCAWEHIRTPGFAADGALLFLACAMTACFSLSPAGWLGPLRARVRPLRRARQPG